MSERKEPEPSASDAEMVYVVISTSYNDDYKCRGGNWSSIEKVTVHKSFQSANAEVRLRKQAYCEEYAPDPEDSDESIDAQFARVTEGEFVESTFDICVYKEEVRE